jgi:YgiT-type zinc finger domain-containing protein
MICLLCRQAEIAEGLTSVDFARGEMTLRVNHVPAQICPGCGEAYVDDLVAVELLREAETMFVTGELENVIEYNGS